MNQNVLTPAQLARIDRNLKKLDDLIPILQRCERCRIPMDEAKVLVDEQRATLSAIRAEFGPPNPTQESIESRR